MTKLTFFILTILALAISCNSGQPKEEKPAIGSATESKFETTEIICDTVYPNKGYKITLTKFDAIVSEYDTNYNTIFTLRKNNQIIFSDSVHNAYQDVRFEDFNGDNVKDILIQNTSSARSVWTYTLYFVDTLNDKFKKVKDFEQIPFPNYLSEYDIVEGYALAGKNWTSFYKIQSDTVYDFGINIEDDLSDNGLYEQEYKNAIKRIMKVIKNSH